MGKVFNTTANCIPGKHYMVDITERLKKIRVMVDSCDYFTMNYARQYGKTTTLLALAEYLKEDYCVLFVDFQMFSEANYSIDEADHASNYQVFLDFLSQLRGSYIRREKRPTFQSVILAGVHDIKNLKRKFVEPGEHNTKRK